MEEDILKYSPTVMFRGTYILEIVKKKLYEICRNSFKELHKIISKLRIRHFINYFYVSEVLCYTRYI